MSWLRPISVLFACLAFSTDAIAEPPHQYVGAAKCKTCHAKELMGDQHRAWLEGVHHRAWQTLASEASLAIAAERDLDAPPNQAPECLRCHTTAFDAPPTQLARPLDPADGVQCESCHGPGRDYRKKKVMSDRDQALAKGLWKAGEDPAICTACHNPESPTWQPTRYELPDGGTSGFDHDQAVKRIPHPIPEDVKGRYLELEKKAKAEEKRRREGR